MEKPFIGVVHFNEKTFGENEYWRTKNNCKGCVYGLDKRIENFPYEENIIIIEMNNDTNEITGIGKIRNILKEENRSRIYSDENYNRLVYKGKQRINRKELIKSNKNIIDYLERILFFGSRHFKRGHGVTKIPHSRLACKYKERPRKKTQCGKCGETGHNKRSCSNEKRVKRQEISSEKKKCGKCGKTLKGHVCGANNINKNKQKELILFLEKLFY